MGVSRVWFPPGGLVWAYCSGYRGFWSPRSRSAFTRGVSAVRSRSTTLDAVATILAPPDIGAPNAAVSRPDSRHVLFGDGAYNGLWFLTIFSSCCRVERRSRSHEGQVVLRDPSALATTRRYISIPFTLRSSVPLIHVPRARPLALHGRVSLFHAVTLSSALQP